VTSGGPANSRCVLDVAVLAVLADGPSNGVACPVPYDGAAAEQERTAKDLVCRESGTQCSTATENGKAVLSSEKTRSATVTKTDN